MSLVYQSPGVYNAVVKLIHGDSLEQRYLAISREVGKSRKVLELGCGTALLSSYLETGCEYEGWDLNDKFVDYCQNRGLSVHKKNVFDVGDNKYQWDVIVICDLLHHLVPNHEKLLEMAVASAGQVVVSEPAKSFKPSSLYRPIKRLICKLIGDYDGINEVGKVHMWDYDHRSLTELFQRYGSHKILRVGRDMIAVFRQS
jgi:SAM-dependent methyltransferase